MRSALCVAAALVGGAFGPAGWAQAADVADFYKANPVKIVVGYTPGGGVDLYSRMLARHMGDNIPGKPTIVVQNMPGAGSMQAVKSIKSAPKDGTYIVAFNPGNITLSLSDPKTIDFNFQEVAYLGSISSEAQMCYMWHTTGVTTFEQMLKRPEIVMGATAVQTSAYMMGAVVRNMFGAKIRHVLGYPGRAEEHLAVERGELDGGCGTWDSTPKTWFDRNQANTIVRLTRGVPADMPKGVPYIGDLATADQKLALNMVLSVNEMFRPYIVDKGIPSDRLKILQDAFIKTVNGEPFLDESKKARRTVEDPMTGPAVAAMVDEIHKASPEVVLKAADAIK